MSESGNRCGTFRVICKQRQNTPTLEFEEFQTNPITYDVQGATAAEAEREVQHIRIVNSLGVFSARGARVLARMYGAARWAPLRVPRTCAHLRPHVRSICTARARVCRANTVYGVSRAADSSLNSVPIFLLGGKIEEFDRSNFRGFPFNFVNALGPALPFASRRYFWKINKVS